MIVQFKINKFNVNSRGYKLLELSATKKVKEQKTLCKFGMFVNIFSSFVHYHGLICLAELLNNQKEPVCSGAVRRIL